MEKDRIYTISTGMKIFYGALGTLLFGFSLYIFCLPRSSNNQAVLIIPILFAIAGILILVNLIVRKVIISKDGISNINVFSKKYLSYADIKGCRVGQKFIAIEPLYADKSKITINNYIDLSDSEQLAAWFSENFTNLDAEDLKENEQKFLNDSSIGLSVEERKNRLKMAKIVAVAYSVIGGFGAFILLITGKSYLFEIICLIYPLLAIPIMKFSRGLIKFTGNSKVSVKPQVLLGVMIPTFLLFINAMKTYQIFQYQNILMFAGVLAVLFFASIYFTGLNEDIGIIRAQAIIMLIISVLYSYSAVVTVNCGFDQSSPVIYKAQVIDHRINSGKSTSYLFTLSEWGPMKKEKEEDVGKWIYDHVPVGDSVKIYFRPGRLNAPWYQVHSFAYSNK